jgi:hypothetical protein
LKWKARKILANPWIVVPAMIVITTALVIKSYFMRRDKDTALVHVPRSIRRGPSAKTDIF